MPDFLTVSRGGYEISTDPARLQPAVIHDYLTNHSYWAKGIPLETVRRSLENSLCFGLYHGGDTQIGFARVVSDFATFAHLCDVFVLPEHRGKGLSKWLMECVLPHPDLQGLRRWQLGTADAHGLYAQFGFTVMTTPDRWMEIARPGIYQNFTE